MYADYKEFPLYEVGMYIAGTFHHKSPVSEMWDEVNMLQLLHTFAVWWAEVPENG
jgi:hypothetical protein